MLKRWIWCAGIASSIACISLPGVPAVFAETLQSPNFRIDESTLGDGGLLQSSSPNYSITDAVGTPAIGETASTNYQIEAGPKTTNDPALIFTINEGATNFGSFSPTSPAVATATFTISNYTSYGYIVQLTGTPPSNGNHIITPMGTSAPESSQPGQEQFGLNVVANTSPAVGANPVYGLFGVGGPIANYGTANKFRFVDGETIVSAPKSSGVTTYTISYIINVNSLTPGGQYLSRQTLVCTGTY